MKGKIFGYLQAVGKAFMLPIALLPIAGLFLGIGASFTNLTNIKTYHLEVLFGKIEVVNGTLQMVQPTILYELFKIISAAGDVVFGNLPLIFAIAISLALAKQEQSVAALSGAVFFLIMHKTINAFLSSTLSGAHLANINEMAANGQGMVLGIQSLEMGVFGGIIAGIITSILHNRFYKQKMPEVLAFFSGTKFVPIVCSFFAIITGGFLYFFWPVIQSGISSLSSLIINSGYLGTFFYGLIERSLIPFGLHHVFYLPFWQTSLGGSMQIAGETIQGSQNIFFAELADPNWTGLFTIEHARFMAGKMPFMIFGLPAAALAMYRCAKNENKAIAGSLIFAAGFTAMLTGITEPIEFSFLFVAPFLYVIHAILAGISFMMMHILNIPIGQTFSGGLIDFILFGVLQGNDKSHWLRMIPLGIVYSIIYYNLFKFLILKFDLKTPGREDTSGEVKMYTRADYNSKNDNKAVNQYTEILEALGGKNNIVTMENCATRLRMSVKDPSLVNESKLKSLGAHGVMASGNAIQVIFGPKVSIIKSELSELMDK